VRRSPTLLQIELLAHLQILNSLHRLYNDQPLSIVPHRQLLSVTFLFPSVPNFKILKRSSTIDHRSLSSIVVDSVAVDSITSCGQVSSFCNCQTANDEDVIALQLKSAGWDATFSALPSRTRKSRGDNRRLLHIAHCCLVCN
jgi:hypothetical protein